MQRGGEGLGEGEGMRLSERAEEKPSAMLWISVKTKVRLCLQPSLKTVPGGHSNDMTESSPQCKLLEDKFSSYTVCVRGFYTCRGLKFSTCDSQQHTTGLKISLKISQLLLCARRWDQRWDNIHVSDQICMTGVPKELVSLWSLFIELMLCCA